MRRFAPAEAAAWAAAGMLVWLLCERAGLDVRVSNAAFDRVHGVFPLRTSWWLDGPGHVGLKYLAWGIWVGVLAVAMAPLRRWRRWRREAAHAALGIALAATAVILLRNASTHSCPWDLAMYGGSAAWFPLFGAPPADAGPGRCLPAAHAASGFALFGLYFALRCSRSGAARFALVAALVVGIVAGAVQVARGAHFVSHVLWTAWIAYGVNLALERLLAQRRSASEAPR